MAGLPERGHWVRDTSTEEASYVPRTSQGLWDSAAAHDAAGGVADRKQRSASCTEGTEVPVDADAEGWLANPEQSEEAEPADDAVVDVEAGQGWTGEREALHWETGANLGLRRGLLLSLGVSSCHLCGHAAPPPHRHHPPWVELAVHQWTSHPGCYWLVGQAYSSVLKSGLWARRQALTKEANHEVH